MSIHLAADPTATGAAVFPARPEWLTLSAALADGVPVIADREDLLVSIAPGAGGGAPGCFYPARTLVEVDGDHLGVDPATVNPANISDRTRYAATWRYLPLTRTQRKLLTCGFATPQLSLCS
jgi:hypothetical protein